MDIYDNGIIDYVYKEKFKQYINNRLGNLEKENTELKLKLEALEGQTPWKDIKDKSELIKENAELKEQLNKNPCVCNTEWHCNDCLEQLTKAKEIISKLLSRLNRLTYTGLNCEERKEAEQFLKE